MTWHAAVLIRKPDLNYGQFIIIITLIMDGEPASGESEDSTSRVSMTKSWSCKTYWGYDNTSNS